MKVDVRQYVSKAMDVCKRAGNHWLSNWVVKGIGLGYAGGKTGQLLKDQGLYDPGLPIAYGSMVWAVGELKDYIDIVRNQNIRDPGTVINLVASTARVLGAVYLACEAYAIGSAPDYNRLALVEPLVTTGKIVGSGYLLEYVIGRPLKAWTSSRWRTAKQLECVADNLRREKQEISEDDLSKLKEIVADIERNKI